MQEEIHTHTQTHVHTRTRTHKHRYIDMYICKCIYLSTELSIKWNTNSQRKYFKGIFNDIKWSSRICMWFYMQINTICVKTKYKNIMYIIIYKYDTCIRKIRDEYSQNILGSFWKISMGTDENDSGRYGWSWRLITGDISLFLLPGPLSGFFSAIKLNYFLTVGKMAGSRHRGRKW